MNWIVGAALILIAALVLDLGLLAYAMYALLGVLLVSRLVSRSWIASVGAQRSCNRLKAEIGDRVAVVVEIANQGRLPIAWMLFEDLLPRDALLHHPPPLDVQGRRLMLAAINSGGRKSLLYQLQCNRRGYYQLGPLVVETGDLFGLQRRFRVVTEPHFLMVYPKILPLEGYDIASRRPIGEVRMSYRLYEDPTRIAGVRHYEQGDPLNRVHWRATARTGVLHSKVYDPSTVAGATLLLDFHQAAHDARNEPVRSELAVTAAASVANAVYEMGQQIGLVTNGRDAADRIRLEGWDQPLPTRRTAQQAGEMLERSARLRPLVVETRRGPEQFQRILETLARVELSDGLRLPELLAEADSRIPRDATLIVILPHVDAEVAVSLDQLQRRGIAVAAILNVFDEFEYARGAGPLLAVGIDTYHLRDEASIRTICCKYVLR